MNKYFFVVRIQNALYVYLSHKIIHNHNLQYATKCSVKEKKKPPNTIISLNNVVTNINVNFIKKNGTGDSG